jgi:putative hydrolase of the HAD superfamily
MVDFSHITDWVFDLDNTLYPAKHDLFDQVDQRMTAFIGEALGLSLVEARRLQKLYLRDYGTTLAGLMHRHAMQPDAFLDFVHDIDVSVLAPAPKLDAALARLPGRKFIFTNGTRAHAERVSAQLGVLHHFTDIFDIVRADYIPKPNANIYPAMLTQFDLEPTRTAFFEDMSRNLKPAHALGMTTILIRDRIPSAEEEAYLGSDDDPHVHHLTHCLETFLGEVKCRDAALIRS